MMSQGQACVGCVWGGADVCVGGASQLAGSEGVLTAGVWSLPVMTSDESESGVCGVCLGRACGPCR
jgi:hypothetical protein